MNSRTMANRMKRLTVCHTRVRITRTCILPRMNIRRTATAAILTALACALPSCGRVERASGTSEDARASTSALPESSQQLLALLPANDEVPGWSLKGNPKFAGPASLWELIDGAAEGYLTYGFQEVVSAHFSAASHELVVDVYRMRDSLNAFGIYAQERNPAAQFVKEGVEGYVTGMTLNFWAGDYYVKITGFEEQVETQHAMQAIASAIVRKIGPAGSAPAEIAWFPTANQIPHSVTYVPKDVLGQSSLTNAFEARYQAGSAEYRLLVADLQNADSAAQAFADYRQFLSGQGRPTTDLPVPAGDEGFTGEDGFYGQVMAARSGRHIVIALGTPSATIGRNALAQVLRNIP